MHAIKQATLADFNSVAELFNQYRVWYGKPSDLEGAKTFLKERLSKNESVIFVVLEHEETIAFAQLYPLFSSTRMKRLWLLNDLFVKTEFRGKGHSKALLERVKQHCHETNSCGFMLETEKSNDIGNALYPAVGMELNTEFNFYHWNVI